VKRYAAILLIFLAGALAGGLVMTLTSLPNRSQVSITVVNLSGNDLENVEFSIGNQVTRIGPLVSGARKKSDTRTKDTQSLSVRYAAGGQVFEFDCGGIDNGEHRTIALLKSGQAMHTFGDDIHSALLEAKSR
jgi:hypothetical protein